MSTVAWGAPSVLVPDWPAPPGVRALFTTRDGGVSRSPWDSFNLGDHVGDASLDVAANRQRLKARLSQGETSVRPVFLQQVHGINVCHLTDATPDGTVADACIVTQVGLACTVMVADCLPVLLADAHGRAVSAAHAGWRGLAAGVLERSVESLRHAAHICEAREACEPRMPIAWLGPCIGPTAFEVGDEVRRAFVAHDPQAAAAFEARLGKPGFWWADLPLLARQRLASVGVTQVSGNDGAAEWCTVSQPSRFFSHRRDAARLGSTGRMAACVWRVA